MDSFTAIESTHHLSLLNLVIGSENFSGTFEVACLNPLALSLQRFHAEDQMKKISFSIFVFLASSAMVSLRTS